MVMKGDEAALIAAAVAGRSYPEIAAAAAVSVSTVQRRLRDPQIVAAVQEGRTQLRRESVSRLNERVSVAVERLGELLMDADPKVALRAVGMVLDNAHKYTMLLEFDERLGLAEASRIGGDSA